MFIRRKTRMHPYESLGASSFWATAVAQKDMLEISNLWQPKIRISERTRFSTYGSCFAQHFGRSLKARGFRWLITEAAPVGLSEENGKKFNYGVFTARTGNLYTTSLLKQWISWADASVSPPDEIWERQGRYYDPFRPNIEPDGFASPQELQSSRATAIRALRQSILKADVFVFTMGLTESWIHQQLGHEYPTCPGTIAGEFSEKLHGFVNQDYPTIRRNLNQAIGQIRKLNPEIQILLTVSPVPLTATLSGQHVLVATMESKSILRAVAGAIQRELPFVDYFPAYEIINAPPYRGSFFEPNQRTVSPAGVDHVMNNFFASLGAATEQAKPGKAQASRETGVRSNRLKRLKRLERQSEARLRDDQVVCEEELLEAFAAPNRPATS
jgi:hypothetical protein